DEIFTPELRKDAQQLKATMLQTCYLRNEGNGRFTMIPLPAEAQFSAVNGMIAEDFDGDGNLDLLMSGNDFSVEVGIGRMDAFNGLLLRGDGTGRFLPLSMAQSGIYIPGDGKALVRLKGANGSYLVAASQNRSALKLFALNRKKTFVSLAANEVSAVIHYADGKSRKEEFYYGSGFLSQSSRACVIDDAVTSVDVLNSKGVVRKIQL
ncbi:MAG: VCBS repeat-containing protein, partial [Chitinophagaceae bacterium]